MKAKRIKQLMILFSICVFSVVKAHAEDDFGAFDDFDDFGEFEEFDDWSGMDEAFEFEEEFLESESLAEDFIFDDGEMQASDPFEAFEEEVFADEPVIESTPIEEIPMDEDPFEQAMPDFDEFDFEEFGPFQEELVAKDEFQDLTPVVSNDPDLTMEARFHDIYIRFHREKTPQDEWEKVLGGRDAETYTIQRGDTLWGISETFFGDGHFWPKVWSLNAAITNPHLIRENNIIQFILGDEFGPPAFMITEVEGMDPTQQMVQGVPIEPPLPPPSVRSRPLVRELPPSLPAWQTDLDSEFDDLGINVGVRGISQIEDSIALSAYVTDSEPTGIGQVMEIKNGLAMAAQFQEVYLSAPPGELNVGDRVLAIKSKGRLQRSTHIVPNFEAYNVEVLGELRILAEVERRDRSSEKLYRAEVEQTLNPISAGAKIVRDNIRRASFNDTGPSGQTNARIIGGHIMNRRQIFSVPSFAYINKGSNQGVQEGQIFTIRSEQALRQTNSIVENDINVIGRMRIVKTSANFSTAIILESSAGILTGDVVGPDVGQAMASR